MKRKNTREEAVKIVYSMSVNNDFNKNAISSHLTNFETCNMDMEYLNKIIEDIILNEEIIDKYITDNSKDWKLSRIAKVDLAILRVAISELLFDDTIPDSVSINEAVEISKKYSNDDAHKFINGILGTVVRSIEK